MGCVIVSLHANWDKLLTYLVHTSGIIVAAENCYRGPSKNKITTFTHAPANHQLVNKCRLIVTGMKD